LVAHNTIFKKVISKAGKTEREVADLCSGLIKYNSAHPVARTDECVDYIKKYMDKHGVNTEIHSQNPLKPNIVAKIEGITDKNVLWVGHLDVVPEGMESSSL
jgi:succinyl-diaminopimelate desuccinylase